MYFGKVQSKLQSNSITSQPISLNISGANTPTMKESYGVYIANAEFLGRRTLYAEIANYKDLDENHNWTIEWIGNN